MKRKPLLTSRLLAPSAPQVSPPRRSTSPHKEIPGSVPVFDLHNFAASTSYVKNAYSRMFASLFNLLIRRKFSKMRYSINRKFSCVQQCRTFEGTFDGAGGSYLEMLMVYWSTIRYLKLTYQTVLSEQKKSESMQQMCLYQAIVHVICLFRLWCLNHAALERNLSECGVALQFDLNVNSLLA